MALHHLTCTPILTHTIAKCNLFLAFCYILTQYAKLLLTTSLCFAILNLRDTKVLKRGVIVLQRTADTNAIKKLMIDNGLNTIKDLSEASGVDRNTLGEVLRGAIQPSAVVMEKLIYALDIPLSSAGMIFFSNNLHNTQEPAREVSA